MVNTKMERSNTEELDGNPAGRVPGACEEMRPRVPGATSENQPVFAGIVCERGTKHNN